MCRVVIIFFDHDAFSVAIGRGVSPAVGVPAENKAPPVPPVGLKLIPPPLGVPPKLKPPVDG